MLELWTALSRAVLSPGNAVKIPRTIMAERFHFNDANSNSGFEVFVDRECRTMWMTLVCCPRRSPKRMRWFERNRQAVEAPLPGMKSDGSGRVTGTLRISSTDDVGEAALAIDAIARLR